MGCSEIAIRALERDTQEGADAVLVKPSLFYGDIITKFKERATSPIAAYIVSGEYKMLFDYGTNCGCLAEVVREAHVGLVRAGADILISYFTPFLLEQRIY